MSAEFPRRYHLLDGCRGLAAIFVMLGHLSSHSGHIGVFVDFFFVLSGFVLTSQIESKSIFRKRKFLISRIIRFYPMLFGVIAFAFFAQTVKFLINLLGIQPQPIYFLIGSFFLIQIFYARLIDFNSPLWSLSAEFWINLLAIFVVTKRQVMAFIGFGIAIFFAGIFLNSYLNLSWQPWTYTFAVGRAMTGFFLGRYLGKIEESKLDKHNYLKLVVSICLLVLVAFYEASFEVFYILGAPISYFIIRELIYVDQSNLPSSILSFCSYLGRISYGIYIWHYAIMQMTPKFGMWLQVFFTFLIVDIYCRFLEQKIRTILEKVFLRPFLKR